MKKLLVILSVTLLIVTAIAAFRDIPKGHWAESYVSRLEQIGIVTGFPDGTYRGDEAVTRYQSALLISRTLDYVELILKDKQTQIDSLLQMVNKLQSALNENSMDIGIIDIKVRKLAEEIQDMKISLENQEKDINKIYDLIAQVQDKFIYIDQDGSTSEINLSEMKNDIAGLSEILSGLAAQLGDVDYLLRKQIADLDKKTSAKNEELEKSVAMLSNKIDELASQLEQALVKLQDINEDIVNVYNTLSEAILSLQEDYAVLSLMFDKLEARMLNVENALATELPMIMDNLSIEIQDMKLVLELHDQDIIKLYDLVTQLQDKFIYTDKEGNTSEINLSQLVGDVNYLLKKQIADLDKKISEKGEELAKSISELSEKTDELASQLEMLQTNIEDTDERISNIYSTLADGILSVQENLTILGEELTARLDEIETKILNIENTLSTGLPAIRSLVYGLSEDLANAQESLKAYTDVIAEELNAKLEEYKLASDEKFKMIEEQLQEKLDKLNSFVVNFKNEVSEKLENLDMRLGLLEEQVVSLTQVVEDVKADKADVEKINEKLSEAEKTAATKKELEQAQTIATWGVITGVSGLIIGIIALGKAFRWW